MNNGVWGGYQESSRGQAANPFLDDNPFTQPVAAPSAAEPISDTLRDVTSPGGSPGPFGSPLSGAGIGPSTGSPSSALQEVPLFDSYSSSTYYATPTSSLRTLPLSTPSTTGAWPPNGSGQATTGTGVSAFNISDTSKSATKNKSKLGKLWSGRSDDITAPPFGATSPSLARREAEVARREAEVSRREASLVSQSRAGVVIDNKNWPFKRFLRLAHHDISGEIPADRRGLVKMAYVAWCLVALGYVWNFICITAFFIGGQKKVSLWVMSGLVAVAGLPLSFLCWYRPLYNVSKADGAARWMWYFLNMMANIVWCWWMFVGIEPNLGGYSAGLFTMIDQFSDGGDRGVTFGVLSVINMALFAGAGALSIVVLGRSWGLFRRGPPVPQGRVRMVV